MYYPIATILQNLNKWTFTCAHEFGDGASIRTQAFAPKKRGAQVGACSEFVKGEL